MTKAIERHPYTVSALACAAVLIIIAALLAEPRTVHSAGGATITGYAWSDNIGWIDLNCANSGVCASNPFGLSINSSGVLSGYAWSDNIGWVSANSADLSGCPSAPCTATISGGTFSGWLKAIGADNNGWDGWISLNGTSPYAYGVTEAGTGGMSGYAWGSDVVGWLSFANATTTYGTCTASTVYTCTGSGSQTITQTTTDTNCNVTTTNTTTCVSPAFCSSGSSVCLYPSPAPVPNGSQSGNLTVVPKLIPSSGTVTVTWDMANVLGCTTQGTNRDGSASSTDSTSPGLWTGASSTKTTSPITQQVTYTLSCTQDDGVTPFSQSATVNVVPTYQER